MKIDNLFFEKKDIIINKRKIYIKNLYYKKNTKVECLCEACSKEYTTWLVNLEKKNFECLCPICERKKNSIRKYGKDHYSKNKKALQNRNKKLKEKYGIINVSQLESTKKTRKENSLKNYGIENPFLTNKSKENRKQTNLNKYGVEYIFQTEKLRKINSEKAKTSNQKNKMSKTKIDIFLDKLFNGDRLNDLVEPLFTRKDYVGITSYYKWRCKKCGHIFESHLVGGRVPRCIKCYPWYTYISSYEKEITSFLEKNNIKYETNNREILNGKELDIYIPSHKLAIEVDGLYWHSNLYIDKNYHLEKTIECEKKGIQLIHIFEDEWIHKKEIVISRLKNRLGLNSKKIGARKTEIKEIDSKTKNQFLEKYHIQGEDKSRIKLGAFYQNALIGVMTFRKPSRSMSHVKDSNCIELSRFATINDTYTPGLASKMLKYFENNWSGFSKIISYADLRWSQGNLYENLNFYKKHNSQPNYWYVTGKKRYHRFKYRKDQLKKLFPDLYNKNKTEFEIMNEAGIYRIYDCGNLKFIKEKHED